jgi:23S rRNA (adenine2503-C2)-methyltransferase
VEAKPALAGLLPGEISGFLEPLPSFRAAQIYQWICSGAASFDNMKNLPLSLRGELAERFKLYSSQVAAELEDGDGTVKFQINLEDGCKIEAVILTDGEGRKTACLSVQAGCPAGCVFCKTGRLGFRRNLRAGEIAEELLFLRRKAPGISHIVIMGMGEPLLNLDELRRAVGFLCHSGGLNISQRRITLSTSGIVTGIKDLADNGPGIRLAFSLTTARQELREKLMPMAKANPLPDLRESLLHYQKKQKHRVTLEAVLLSGVNTGAADAEAMADFAQGLDTVINLIPWNPVEGLSFRGLPLRSPAPGETAAFAAALKKRGLNVTFRWEKGRSVSGACGQLGSLE